MQGSLSVVVSVLSIVTTNIVCMDILSGQRTSE